MILKVPLFHPSPCYLPPFVLDSGAAWPRRTWIIGVGCPWGLANKHISLCFNGKLVGGFKYVLIFTPKPWGNDPNLTNMFQSGWNHQPVNSSTIYLEICVNHVTLSPKIVIVESCAKHYDNKTYTWRLLVWWNLSRSVLRSWGFATMRAILTSSSPFQRGRLRLWCDLLYGGHVLSWIFFTSHPREESCQSSKWTMMFCV